MVRTKEGGSVLSFIVIGVVLTALFIGGVYFVHRQTQPPESPAPAQPEKTKQQPEEKKPASSPQSQKQSDKSKKSDQKEQQANQPQEKSTPPASSDETAKNEGSELPQTGPAGVLASLLALGIVSAVAVSYLRSRRPELSL